jgi:replicative DNA helicase
MSDTPVYRFGDVAEVDRMIQAYYRAAAKSFDHLGDRITEAEAEVATRRAHERGYRMPDGWRDWSVTEWFEKSGRGHLLDFLASVQVTAPAPPAPANTDPLRVLDGLAFLQHAKEAPPALWGTDEEVLWSSGEALLIVAKANVGKTTLAHNLLGPLTNEDGGEVMGVPVRPVERPVLYIAADRPIQAARSLERFALGHEDGFKNRLKVWRGPLPFDVKKDPGNLAQLIADNGCGAGIIDSLGNITTDLTSDEGGLAINRMFAEVVVNGYQLAALHHQRKATAENKKPQSLADVYGSQWITAGAGSVLYLHGEPGDVFLELMHLKSPFGEVGPFGVVLEADGTMRRDDERDPLAVLRARPDGITAAELAAMLAGKQANKNQIEKARRKLERFVKLGIAMRRADRIDGTGGPQAGVVYQPHDGSLRVAR